MKRMKLLLITNVATVTECDLRKKNNISGLINDSKLGRAGLNLTRPYNCISKNICTA